MPAPSGSHVRVLRRLASVCRDQKSRKALLAQRLELITQRELHDARVGQQV